MTKRKLKKINKELEGTIEQLLLIIDDYSDNVKNLIKINSSLLEDRQSMLNELSISNFKKEE